MYSFSGNNAVSIDAKGRAGVPARMRDGFLLSGAIHLVAVKAIDDKCIWLYTNENWEALVQELHSKPTSNPKYRTFLRNFVGNAYPLEADTAGRILLPQSLRDYAGLTKKSMFVGQVNKVEIWNEESWLDTQELDGSAYDLDEVSGVSF